MNHGHLHNLGLPSQKGRSLYCYSAHCFHPSVPPPSPPQMVVCQCCHFRGLVFQEKLKRIRRQKSIVGSPKHMCQILIDCNAKPQLLLSKMLNDKMFFKNDEMSSNVLKDLSVLSYYIEHRDIIPI